MNIQRVYVVVALSIDLSEDEDIADVISEMEYDFEAAEHMLSSIVDTEIISCQE